MNNRVLANNSVLAGNLAAGAMSTRLRYNVVNIPTGMQMNVFARCNAADDGQAPINGRIPVGWNVGVVNESNQVVQASAYVVCLRA